MSLWLLAAGLALTPVVFGGRASARLATARWTRRCPRAALVLWQAIGLAGGLGAVGLGLVASVAPVAAVFPHGMHTLVGRVLAGPGLTGLGPAPLVALAWSLGVLAWLLAHTVRVTVKTVAEQRRQRLLVDLVADHAADHDAYILPTAERIAYCVPGRRVRVVLSQGTLDLLNRQELLAVLGHERAHARGRHDLILLPFVALAEAFPWLAAARAARQAVPVLLEMLADDQARRVHGELPLARALVRMATPRTGSSAAGVRALADAGVVHRLERLLGGADERPRWIPAVAYSIAGLLLVGPLAVLVAPLLCVVIRPA
ncbi:M56 family metallopeptidase [Microbispora cellulosiformans]|uniref:M56 family metallopeptidase n=1 Tax=Microbispora cellulosiformans TaxID=2614688 RepID=A0A5J5KC75_9ACTN|nr:M56 family metallopeptidase [Microbispora cellulosiformans]KAA9381418.1 M56 family metallopeptidase [Microbispora cellulosiformans]